MSHYDSPVPKVISDNPKMMKFRRRVLNSRKMNETPTYRKVKVGGYFLMAFSVVYTVLFADWGDREHCYSGVRRYYYKKRREFFSLSENDKQGTISELIL
ncbi:hypothetical protein HK099_007521 [Clydaea vesicula]|uniref:Transmembrane protein n=1 Tax=Clydaea vesicula TaxID=447962 RepID=A0AAD5TWF5_9FUNG|nr:hypothetical protein HK099_007521 [Clydaea vesicula]